MEKKENKNNYLSSNLFSETFDRVKSLFKHSPTSQKCLDYHEALLVDSRQVNFIEVS